jgi:hypothetical protein
MSKDFIESRIDMAHNAIDEGNPQGAIGLLKNLKLRIHDRDVETKIKDFEERTDHEVEHRMKEISISDDDELRKDANRSKAVVSWAKKYLDFYDRVLKEYDVY